MANTERLDLYKVPTDPVEQESTNFNTETMLNQNWEKIDSKVATLGPNGKIDPDQIDIDTSDLAKKQEVENLGQTVTSHLAEKATLTTEGHVQLSNSTTSTSDTLAATPSAVKSAMDRANEAFTLGNSRKVEMVDALLSVDSSLPITHDSSWEDIINVAEGISFGPSGRWLAVLMANEEQLASNNVMTSDADYIYVAASATSSIVRKYRKSDMSFVRASVVIGSVTAIAVDESHIYVSYSGIGTIRVLSKSDMSLVGTLPNYGGSVNSIVILGDYLYAAGSSANRVTKYSKSSSSIVGHSASYGEVIYSMVTDGVDLFIGGIINSSVNRYIKKVDTEDLSFIGDPPATNSNVQTMAYSEGVVYALYGALIPNQMFDSETLELIGESEPTSSGTIYSAATDNESIYYVGNSGHGRVTRADKYTLEIVFRALPHQSSLRGLEVDSEYVYSGGINSSNYEIWKYIKGR